MRVLLALALLGACLNVVSAAGLCDGGAPTQLTATSTPALFPGIWGVPVTVSSFGSAMCMWQVTAPVGSAIKFTIDIVPSGSYERMRTYEGTSPNSPPNSQDLPYDNYVGLFSTSAGYPLTEGDTITSYTNKVFILLSTDQPEEFTFNFTVQAVPQNKAKTACQSTNNYCYECTTPPDNCANCSTTSGVYCVDAKLGYFSTNGLPAIGCADDNCFRCSTPTGTGKCTVCATGYYLTTGNTCAYCPSSCNFCYPNGTCSGCGAGYHYEPSGDTCCEDGYFYSSGCRQCSVPNGNCAECYNAGTFFDTCTRCEPPYLPVAGGECGICGGGDTHCATCIPGTLQCATCPPDYYILFNGTCYNPGEEAYCDIRCAGGESACKPGDSGGNTTYHCVCTFSTDGEWCDQPKMCIKTVGIVIASLGFFLIAGVSGVIEFVKAAKKKMEQDKKEMEEAEGKGVEAMREIWERNDKDSMAIHKDTTDKEFGYLALIRRKDLEKPREPLAYWLRHGYDFSAPCFPFKGEQVLLRNRVMLMFMTILSAIFFNILLAQLGGGKKVTAESGSIFKIDFGRGVWIGLLCNVLKKIFGFIIKRGLRAEALLEAGVVNARREARVAKVAAATGVAVDVDPSAPPKPKMTNQPNKKVGIIMVIMFAIIVCINLGVIFWQLSVQTCANFFGAFVSSYVSSLVLGAVVYVVLGVGRYFFLKKFGAEPKAEEKTRY